MREEVRREEGLVTDGFTVIEGRGKTSANGIFCNRAISMRSNAVSLDYLYCESRWRHCRDLHDQPTPKQKAQTGFPIGPNGSLEQVIGSAISFLGRARAAFEGRKKWDFSRTLSPIAAHRWIPTSTAG